MPGNGAGHGYGVAAGELKALVTTLGDITDAMAALVASADRLAQRTPLLGTAPPARALAARLRETAGQDGLTGELGTAVTRLRDCHQSMASALARYLDVDEAVADTVHAVTAPLDEATGALRRPR